MDYLRDTLIWQVLPYLFAGARTTILLSATSMALALMVGLLAALARLSRHRYLRWISNIYVEVVRGTPLLVQLFIIYYGLPQYGIKLDAFVAGFLTLGFHYGAYLSEVYRAGIVAVEKGQIEAAQSIGMSRAQVLREVILPQALPVVLPPIGNYFISMLKDSALTATISVTELLRAGQLKVAITFMAMEIYIIVAAIYFAMSFPIALLVRRFERRLSHGNHH